MMVPPTSEQCARRFAQAFAAHWGLDVCALEKHLISHLKRMPAPPPHGAAQESVEAALMQPALDFRNRVMGPVLEELFDWLRARLSYKLGKACHAYRDDAVSQALKALVDHWKAWWMTPAGQDHLRRYALVTALRMAVRMTKGDEALARGLSECEPGRALDPEAETLQSAEQLQRAIAQSKLRDLGSLLDMGLPPAEANAVVRWLGVAPAADLDRRAAEALRKAFQRGRERLRTLADRLGEDRRRHPRSAAHCWCTVERLGLRGRYRVLDYAAGGLGLERPLNCAAALEIGADCTVRIHSGSTVIVRGATCVRIDRADGKVRVGLRFHFPHPMPPLPRRHQEAQLTL